MWVQLRPLVESIYGTGSVVTSTNAPSVVHGVDCPYTLEGDVGHAG